MTSPRTGCSCWSLTITGLALAAVDLEVDQRASRRRAPARSTRASTLNDDAVAARRRRRRRARGPSGAGGARRGSRARRAPRRRVWVASRPPSAARQCSGGRVADAAILGAWPWRDGATTDSHSRQGRVRRTAEVGSALGTQGARYAGTARGEPRPLPGRRAAEALERRHLEAAERMVTTLGRMKGAAMKIGQLASFIDTEFLPAGVPRAVPGASSRTLRTSAPPMPWKKVERCSTRSGTSPSRSCSRTSSTRRPRPPRSARCTAPCCPTGGAVAVKIQYPGVAEAICGRHAERRA